MNNKYDAAKTTLEDLGYTYTAGNLKWKLKVGKGSYVEPAYSRQEELTRALNGDSFTYTQKMVDAGVMPSVSMECAFETTFFTMFRIRRVGHSTVSNPLAYD